MLVFFCVLALSSLTTIICSQPKQKKVICFHTNQCNERGTEIALFDYAHYTELIFNYTSKMIFPNTNGVIQGASYNKFKARFDTTLYEPYYINGKALPGNINMINAAVNQRCDLLYIIKDGMKGGHPVYPISFDEGRIKTAVHAVFSWQPHGTAYAAISPDVTGKDNINRAIVPHIVAPTDTTLYPEESFPSLRQEFNISSTDFVLCRHGSKDSFDIKFVKHAICTLVAKYNHDSSNHYREKINLHVDSPDSSNHNNSMKYTGLHVVFLGTDPISDCQTHIDRSNTTNTHAASYIHYLPTTSDQGKKEQFFRTCDAMIHARSIGESFGLAVAEFSVRNKPVITHYGGSLEHIRILGDKGFIYQNKTELFQIVHRFMAGHSSTIKDDYNAYQGYMPQNVMALFKKHFFDVAGII